MNPLDNDDYYIVSYNIIKFTKLCNVSWIEL